MNMQDVQDRQHELLDRAGIPRQTGGAGLLSITERLYLLVGRYERLRVQAEEMQDESA